jgi:hypothetical protein
LQELFEQSQQRIASFLEGRKNPTLVVAASETETLIVLKMLEAIEADSADMLWAFPFEFESPHQYVMRAVEAIGQAIEATSAQCLKEGLDPLPTLPEELQGSGLDPVERMRSLCRHTRHVMPAPDAMRSIIALFPTKVHDSAAYALFVQRLTEHEMPRPWCAGMRFVVRDPKEQPVLQTGAMREMPRTEWFRPDFSTETLSRALEDQAYNDSVPLPARMQALVQCAAIDYGHARYPAAVRKYQLAVQYYAATDNPPLLALSLNGIGEVFHRSGDRVRARDFYGRAMQTVVEAQEFTMLVQVALNLGRLEHEERHYDKAFHYFDQVMKMAAELRNADVMAYVYELRGQVDFDRREYVAATATWIAGATFAREMELDMWLARLLTKLERVLKQMHLRDRLEETRRELRLVKLRLDKECPNGAPEIHA